MPGVAAPLGSDLHPVLRDLGVDPDALVSRVGLDPAQLRPRGPSMSASQCRQFWLALEEEASSCRLAQLLADAVPSGTLHPPLFASLCCADLRAAAHRLSAYKERVSPVRVCVEDRPDGFFVGFEWERHGVPLPRALALAELSVFVRMAREGLQTRVVPIRLQGPNPLGCADMIESFFGVRQVWGSRVGVLFDRADAKRPFRSWARPSGDASTDPPASVSEAVHRVLLQVLPAGTATVRVVAKKLGMGARTLQRRLYGEGTSFQAALQTMRYALATHYLRYTDISIKEIAFLVGFGETNSFFRAFRMWSGTTPEAARLGGPLPIQGGTEVPDPTPQFT